MSIHEDYGKLHAALEQNEENVFPVIQVDGPRPNFRVCDIEGKWTNVCVPQFKIEEDETSIEEQMVKQSWETIVAAATDRNIICFDSDRAEGGLTQRLIAIMKAVFRRNRSPKGWLSGGRMTQLWIDDDTWDSFVPNGKQIRIDIQYPKVKIRGVELRPLELLNQYLQEFYTENLSAHHVSGRSKIIIGMDSTLRGNEAKAMTLWPESYLGQPLDIPSIMGGIAIFNYCYFMLGAI